MNLVQSQSVVAQDDPPGRPAATTVVHAGEVHTLPAARHRLNRTRISTHELRRFRTRGGAFKWAHQLLVDLVEVDADRAPRPPHSVSGQLTIGDQPTHRGRTHLQVLGGLVR
jgi:hypothetical protein